MSGTVILKPAKAGDVTVKDTLHVISIGGFDYADIGLTGAFTKNDSATASLIDSLSPITVYSSTFGSSFDFAAGFNKKGPRRRTVSTPTSTRPPMLVVPPWLNSDRSPALGLDLDGEIWVAKKGGYPVSMTITASSLATATSEASVMYARSFDITKVNDAGNKVTAPTNVTGA